MRCGPSPPGRLVDVGGYCLHVRDLGYGGPPAVVLEAGAGGWSSHWGSIPDLLAGSMRVIAYDRAGLGWSDPRPGLPSADALAADVLKLLDALGVREPVILVGHSFGAAIARFIASRHPARVGGLAFIDGWHESMADWERLRGLRSEPSSFIRAAHLMLANLGVLRALSLVLPIASPPWPISKEIWRAIVLLSSSRKYARTCWQEVEVGHEIDRSNANESRISVPARALVARQTLSLGDAPRGYPVAEHNAAWIQASSRLVGRAATSSVQVVEDCDHMIPLRHPHLVVTSLEELLATVRREERSVGTAATAQPDVAADERVGRCAPSRPRR